MSSPAAERPDLPEYMTWEQLEQLPEEVAGQIELWNGRVVWVRRGPAEHQEFTNLMWSGLRRCARAEMARTPEHCWRVHTETNVFLGRSGKNDFVTPDFLVHRCLPQPYQDVRADDVLLAGEVLSPSNTQTDIDEKKARYATAGIPWYWEVTLERGRSAIAMVRAYALETDHGKLPPGVHPLYPANYLLTGKWTPKSSDAIVAALPFPIHIPWTDLEF
ncbi:Uma2 family endonuclease [Nocardia pseudobrasiliensis]|uniref:Uma2 family endonuclease n=1 Tax=Nocardia pseudobrasiliensis TaxID=45979 RepID=A0A370I1E0_9NOCA|nr:Uma2 family endonuclease [Nocardia pseudobrasiliensis]RDI64546.1 Uma2 family endonuclease [Nocardia pseudobrasiliensis]